MRNLQRNFQRNFALLPLFALGLTGIITNTGCSSKVTRNNPYDEDAPASIQAAARIEGSVILEGAIDYSGVKIIVTEAVSDSTPLSYDSETGADGAFVVEIPAGSYNLKTERLGYIQQFINNIEIRPGDVRGLGVLRLVVARGSLQGKISMDDGGSPAGATVSVIPSNQADAVEGGLVQGAQEEETTVLSQTVVVGPDGSYYVDGLAEGNYVVRAEKDEYAPAYTDDGLAVQVNQMTAAPDLVLYPASAIVQVEVDGQINAKYTNHRDVQVLLLAFVEFLTDMRVSEDESFVAEAWDVAYKPFNAEIEFELGDEDGEHFLHGQFRDSFGQESNLFSSSVILDREIPVISSFKINDGASYLTSIDGAGLADLSFSGRDDLSGISAYRYTLEADITDVAWELVDSVGQTLNFSFAKGLGDDDGLKTVLLQVRDRAGNLSEIASASILRDKTAPAVATPPFTILEPLSEDGSAAVDLNVRVKLNAAADRDGEKLYFAIANASGLDATTPLRTVQDDFLTDATTFWHTLAGGRDEEPRQVCVIFKDEAGLYSAEFCEPVNVNRKGVISGVAQLEAETSHEDVLVQVWHFSDPTTVWETLSQTDGSFEIADLPAGSGYVMRLSKDGFLENSYRDLVVLANGSNDRGTLSLMLPRFSVTGTILLVGAGSGQHAGTVVSEESTAIAAVTGPNGAFIFSDLPLNRAWTFSARNSGFLTHSFAPIQPQDVSAGETYDLGEVTLQKQEGDFAICAGDDISVSPCAAIPFSASRTVRLDVQSNLTFWRYGLLADMSDAGSFVSYDNSVVHVFDFDGAALDGQKTIYIQFSEDGTNEDQAVISGIVTLDTKAPVPAATNAVLIDLEDTGDGAIYTNHPTATVSLSLSASDEFSGVAQVKILNTYDAAVPTDFSAATAQTYRTSSTFNLDASYQGEQWVWLQFCDAVGNCTVNSAIKGDSIIYD
ncbi:carboxypeptidase regulatory-like domain-containing protein, partial [Myxococcota bacterium]|nr:carboxypeptidase regulatory-like domain-containing protein [Myxococcota bacterium]